MARPQSGAGCRDVSLQRRASLEQRPCRHRRSQHGHGGSPRPDAARRPFSLAGLGAGIGQIFLHVFIAVALNIFLHVSSTTIADSPNCFEGEHDGYRRLGVKHRRMVQCVTEDAWVIVDDLLGAGEHELRLHWLLPDLPFEVIADSPFWRGSLFRRESALLERWNVFLQRSWEPHCHPRRKEFWRGISRQK